MYIGFLNDRKELQFLIEEEKILFVKPGKGQKRKLMAIILFGGALVFGPLKASASDELPDWNKMAYERVNLLDFNRGGFSARPMNIETLGKQLSQEYKDYQKDFNSPPLSKRFDTLKFSQVRFRELAKDPNARMEVYHKKTVYEARSALQAESMGLVEDVERIPQPYCKRVDLDFRVSGPPPYTHLDVKHPVGSAILKKQGRNIKLRTMASDLGEDISDQKKRFCGLDQGPKSSRNVLHIVDLCYVPSHEKEIVKDFCVKAAGSLEGILFINVK